MQPVGEGLYDPRSAPTAILRRVVRVYLPYPPTGTLSLVGKHRNKGGPLLFGY